MGKNPAAKRAAQRMKNPVADCESQIASLRGAIKIIALLGVFCAFAGNSFTQDIGLTEAQTDWRAEKVSLEQKLQSGSDEQKRDALSRIRNLETAEASLLAVPALRDQSEIVRATAVFSVIFLSKDEALNVLLPLLNDKKELVRRETAYALGKVGNPNALNPLLQVFQKDKIADVKNACIVALGEIGDVAAIDALTGVLQNKPKKENPADEFLRRSAARSIGQIAQIIQTNKTEILTPENLQPDKYKTIEKPKYAKLVETFPVFRLAITVLIETLQNPRQANDVKREAAFALGAIGDESAKPVLQSNLNNEDYYLAEISKEALRKISLNSNEKGLE
jgi:HEAT repeat protein